MARTEDTQQIQYDRNKHNKCFIASHANDMYLLEEELGEVRPVLAGDSGDDGLLHDGRGLGSGGL